MSHERTEAATRASEDEATSYRPACIVCDRPTDGVCGDWCDECDGQPMCATCALEHWEDLHA